MALRKLGRTDLLVSRACLGTMTFGTATRPEVAHRLVDTAIDHGINFFDTANVYGGGQAEVLIGNALRGRRSRVVLASKVGGKAAAESGPRLSWAAVVASIDETLRRLQTDYLDIYYLHMPDDTVAVEETAKAMDELVRSGKVRYPAVSNHAAWQICRILWLCDKLGSAMPGISQPPYNVVARGVEREHVPFCKEFGLAIVSYNPLASGLLTDQATTPRDPRAKYGHPMFARAAESLRRASKDAGRSLVDVALNWLLHHSATEAVVLGVETVEQLEQNLGALERGPLPDEILNACEAAWQTLRGVEPYDRGMTET